MKKKFFVFICSIFVCLFCFCGCNQQFFDSTKYEVAYVKIDGKWNELEVVTWRQSYNVIWLTLTDGTSLMVDTSYCILVSGDLPFELD